MEAPLMRWHNRFLEFLNFQAEISLLWTDLQCSRQQIFFFFFFLLSAPLPKQKIPLLLLCACVTLCISPVGVRAVHLSKHNFSIFPAPSSLSHQIFRGPHFCHGLAGTMCVCQQGWEQVLADELSCLWITVSWLECPVTMKQFWRAVQYCTQAALPCPLTGPYLAWSQSSHPPACCASYSYIHCSESGICLLCFVVMKLWAPVRRDFHLRCSAAIQVSFFPLLLTSMYCSAAVDIGC